MTEFRCALVSLNQTPLDWRGNYERIDQALASAAEWGCHFVCLPELCIPGYGCEDYFLRSDTMERSLKMLLKLANAHDSIAFAAGLPMQIEGSSYNCLAIVSQGKVRAIIPKTHLAREGIHYEPRWFRGWQQGYQTAITFEGNEVPVGNLLFEMNRYRFSFEICEDAWVGNDLRPCRTMMGRSQGVFNASASHFSFGKCEQRDRILEHSSRDFKVDYFYTNLLGCESGRAIYDGEMLVAREGKVVQRSSRLSLEEWELLIHDIETPDGPDQTHSGIALFATERSRPKVSASNQRSFAAREDAFPAAATLGLFDYMRKSGSRGFTISLSGGVDSAVCAILSAITCQRMGERMKMGDSRLDYLNLDDRPISEQLVTTVYQSTRNSGSVTRQAAQALAEHLGIAFHELDVDALVEGYKQMVSGALGRQLSWKKDDLALQNIQARTRGPGIWMFANLSGSLLLTTSNRSEVAVGYATMDGDTCGGLAPIAGVEKTFLRSWLNHLETENLELQDAIACLKYINQQAPTAELRPQGSNQADEKDLMPYEVLDALEESLVLNRVTAHEAYANLIDEFGSSWSHRQLRAWTTRFLKLFAISQWKRERYAPSFHLDDRSLDPKTWARFPILSGNFAVDIEEVNQISGE